MVAHLCQNVYQVYFTLNQKVFSLNQNLFSLSRVYFTLNETLFSLSQVYFTKSLFYETLFSLNEKHRLTHINLNLVYVLLFEYAPNSYISPRWKACQTYAGYTPGRSGGYAGILQVHTEMA